MKTLILSTLTLSLAPGYAPAAQEASAESSEFGEPVIVNGQRISDLEIKRYLIYGPGQTILETERLGILIDKELEHRRAQLEKQYSAELFGGKDLAALTPEEKQQLEAKKPEVMARVDEQIGQFRLDEKYHDWVREQEFSSFRERYPTLDLSTEVSRAYGASEWYDLQVRRTLEFDECFFKGDPDNWPDLTKEAIWAGSPDIDLVADMKESWDRRVEQAAENGQPYPRREDEMFFGLLREYVIDMLGTLVEQKTAVEGISDEFVLSIQGEGWSSDVRTEEIWKRLESHITSQDIRVAKRWLAVMAATEDQLEKEGHLVSPEEHRAHLDKTREELKQSMFSMEFLAVTGHGFPSTQSFRRFLRSFESYRKKLADILAPQPNGDASPILIDYLPIANNVLGVARADVEIMLVGAFDQANYAWKEGGWEWAKAEADRLRAELDAHLDKLAAQEADRQMAAEKGEAWEPKEEILAFDRYWAQMLDLHSEFWDPPMPESGKAPAMQGLQNKGRFGNQPRNDLERSVSESSFTKVLTGGSMADRVFLDMQAGDLGGPFRGPQGYYIIYVKSKSAPSNPIGTRSERHRELLADEYVRQTFAEYAQQALAAAETSGVPEV